MCPRSGRKTRLLYVFVCFVCLVRPGASEHHRLDASGISVSMYPRITLSPSVHEEMYLKVDVSLCCVSMSLCACAYAYAYT